MKVINKCLCSHSAVTFKERINGTLMIPMEKSDVINSFTFDIFSNDPSVPLQYSYILNNAKVYRKSTWLSRLRPVVNHGLLHFFFFA